ASPPLTMLTTSAFVNGFCCASDETDGHIRSSNPIFTTKFLRTVSPLASCGTTRLFLHKVQFVVNFGHAAVGLLCRLIQNDSCGAAFCGPPHHAFVVAPRAEKCCVALCGRARARRV